MNMNKTVSAIILGVSFSTFVHAQSVADFARQERARRGGSEAKIKISNENLSTKPQAAPATDAKPAAEQGAAPETPAATKVTDRKGRDEKWWHTAFEEARSDLKHAEDQIKVLQLKLNQTHMDYLQKTDMYNREMRLAAEITDLNNQMDAEQKKADAARKKIEDLEDELRRSGGLPGWAR
jgi:predicted RNase H-like nuclease (RuvC/YqgF family)